VRVQLDSVSRHHGAHVVLDGVSVAVTARSRIGLVGPNGSGKSTLLRLLARVEAPDAGTVSWSPATLTAGYLPQEPDARSGETLLQMLRRRTGVAAAEEELEGSAAALADFPGGAERYEAALARYLALGGADLEPRAAALCAELGLSVELERGSAQLSGGEAARAQLAAILLSRFDLLLLDEPTNDLDFDGLERLERFLAGHRGAIVAVSHDRAFLDRIVRRVWAVDPWTNAVREYAGGWTDYAAARDAARRAAYARFDEAQRRRRELAGLLSRRRTEAHDRGAALGEKSGGADRRGTRALRTKVRQAERLLERTELPDKPYEPWQLRLSLGAGRSAGGTVLALSGAEAQVGSFRLGPLDLDLAPGERVAVTGRNGSGKTTLLRLLEGGLPLAAGERRAGARTRIGTISQRRGVYGGADRLLDVFGRRTGLVAVEARTLLAKFGLAADHVDRPCASLSPGERTRAHLAELQARSVDVLLLDEPTNHLDLEAVEQLEQALAGFDGTLVVVSHDRRFLEALAPTCELPLEAGRPGREPMPDGVPLQ
jgi:ATPase subunit of ABC transporter with duplicated ATPase domains